MTNSNTIARSSLFTALLSACVALSTPALAAADDGIPRAVMPVQNIDFSSPRAVSQLKSRLRRVAMGMCVTSSGDGWSLKPDERTCYETAVRDGLAQIGNREQQAVRERSIRLADARATVAH